MSTACVLLPCPGVTPRVLHAGGLGRRVLEGSRVGTEPALPQSSFPAGARHVGDFPGSAERDVSCD